MSETVPFALSTWLPAEYLLRLPTGDAKHDDVASYALAASRDDAGPATVLIPSGGADDPNAFAVESEVHLGIGQKPSLDPDFDGYRDLALRRNAHDTLSD